MRDLFIKFNLEVNSPISHSLPQFLFLTKSEVNSETLITNFKKFFPENKFELKIKLNNRNKVIKLTVNEKHNKSKGLVSSWLYR